MRDRARLRIVVLRVVVLSLFVTLGARLWFLEVPEGSHYRKAAEENRVREVVTPAARGLIVDDSGRALVRNRSSLEITVDRSVTDRQVDAGKAVLTRLATVLGEPYAELHRRIEFCSATVKQPCWNGSPYQPVPVATDVPPQQALAIIEHPDQFPGIAAGLQAVRQYPYGTIASHELGYLTPVTQSELDSAAGKKTYHPGSLVGASGLEETYDSQLRGRDGVKKLSVDRYGRVSGTVAQQPAQTGNTLVLSLDVKVQKVVETALQHALQKANAAGKTANNASAVVLDPRDGRVVAMASLPSYDPADFIGGISQKDYNELTASSSDTPLLSRAFQGSYSPGSTFKPVSLSAAVTLGGQDLGGSYSCAPTLQVGNQTFHNFDGESAGDISLRQAIVISCDVIFDKFGYDAWLADGGLRNKNITYPPAKQTFVKMARAYGFGRDTGIDLPGESSGSVVDRAGAQKQYDELKTQYCRRAKVGYPEVKDPAMAARYKAYAVEACRDGYLYSGGAATQFAIGQGQYLSVTPLQMAVAYAAIANGGTVFSPRVASAVLSPNGKVVERITPPKKAKLPVAASTLAYLRDALRGVVEQGTASGVFAGWPQQQIPVAGKTGTAEVENQGDTSWFASFAPANDPRYVVVVSIPDTGQGADFAAPAVREIYQGIFGVGQQPAVPGGKVPIALPKVAKDGSISAPGSRTAPATAGASDTAPAPAASSPPPGSSGLVPPNRTAATLLTGGLP